MRNCLAVVLAVLWIISLRAPCASADEVILKSGIKMQGKIIEADSAKVVVETAAGKLITYKRADVAEIRTEQSVELARADQQIKSGNMNAAQKTLEAIIASGGILKADAQMRLMQCYFSAGQWEKGARLYFEALNAAPVVEVAASLPWHGLTVENAQALLKGATSVAGLSGAAASVLDVIKAWAKCVQDASADVKSLASKDPVAGDIALIAQMQLMFLRKDYDGCLALIEKRLPKMEGPVQMWAFYWKGRCLLEKDDLERAALAFLRVGLASEPLAALAGDSLYMAAVCFERKHQNERATELYREIAECYPIALCASEARKKAGL